MDRQGRTGGRYPLADLELALADRARPNPLVVLWRWRYEVGALAAIGLALWSGAGYVLLAIVAALGALAMWPPARRVLIARAWCVVTPHRVRTACAEAWIHSRSGKIPIVLWTSPRPYGERVALWCPAGTTAADLQTQHTMLATACWAERVHVVPNTEHRQVVVLQVVRNGHGSWAPAPLAVPGDTTREVDDRQVHLLPPPDVP
ncbi:MAG TPA: hypothetical protein VGP02_07205 [Mycobacteriales bacterium]|jgi:hypothetical protein|nr:hypothetical protein [Mycobacteriales bacterium]